MPPTPSCKASRCSRKRPQSPVVTRLPTTSHHLVAAPRAAGARATVGRPARETAWPAVGGGSASDPSTPSSASPFPYSAASTTTDCSGVGGGGAGGGSAAGSSWTGALALDKAGRLARSLPQPGPSKATSANLWRIGFPPEGTRTRRSDHPEGPASLPPAHPPFNRAAQIGSLPVKYGSAGGASGTRSRGPGRAAAFRSHSGPPGRSRIERSVRVATVP